MCSSSQTCLHCACFFFFSSPLYSRPLSFSALINPPPSLLSPLPLPFLPHVVTAETERPTTVAGCQGTCRHSASADNQPDTSQTSTWHQGPCQRAPSTPTIPAIFPLMRAPPHRCLYTQRWKGFFVCVVGWFVYVLV